MPKAPCHLLRDTRLLLLDFDGVVTTEEEDVALKVQIPQVFAGIAARFEQRALKMMRLLGRSVYKSGGTFSLGPLVYHGAHILKPADEPLHPTLDALIQACVRSLDYGCVRPVAPVVREGLRLLQEEGIQLAVYTNGLRDNALEVMAAKGLDDVLPPELIFDAIFTRDAFGKLHPKPQPEGFHRVLEALETAPTHCTFVDNSRKNARTAKSAVGCGCVVYIGEKLKPKDQGVIDHLCPSLEALMTEVVRDRTRA